jgi:hypothetical protein
MKSVLEAMTELVSRGYPKETAYRIANGDLPMDRASRMERARQQGYDPDDIQYHGTSADISSFRESDGGALGSGVYTTDNPDLASLYAQDFTSLAEDLPSGANVLPLLLRGDQLSLDDFANKFPDYRIEDLDAAQYLAREDEGITGIREAKRLYAKPGDVVSTFDARDIRSVNAAFDPQYKGANILGGTAATAVGAGALMAPNDASAAIEDVDIFEEESPMTYRDRRRDRRQRAQDQRERVSGGDEPLLSGAQTANLVAGLTGVAGIADIFGEYPEFPEGDVSVEEMVLEGQRGPSLAENIGEGNYLSAGLQTLGVIPLVGIGARAAAKALRSADGITSLPINKQIEVMETVREGTKLDAPVFAPKIFEEGGKPDVRRMEAALKSNQGDLSSVDDMVERAQSVNDGFQSNVAEVAEAVGGKKAGKFITLKDGSQFDVEVKSAKSIADKIERKGLTPSEFTDGVRTTIYVDTADQAEEAVQRLGSLYPSIDRGWQRLPDTGYFDRKMNLAIEDPKTGGFIIGEIQIKTPEMAEAAIPGHRWYEYSRKLEGRYDHNIPATKIQLYKKALEEQRRLYGEAESVADPEILRQLVEKFKAGGAVASPRRSHRSGIQTLAEGYPRLP